MLNTGCAGSLKTNKKHPTKCGVHVYMYALTLNYGFYIFYTYGLRIGCDLYTLYRAYGRNGNRKSMGTGYIFRHIYGDDEVIGSDLACSILIDGILYVDVLKQQRRYPVGHVYEEYRVLRGQRQVCHYSDGFLV